MPTAAETKKQYIEKMGKPLGVQFAALWQEVALLYLEWADYVALFGTNAKRVELLNQSASTFFRMLQDRLWEATVLHLARLTDPPCSPGGKDKQNLTIQNLPGLIDDDKIKSVTAALIAIALTETKFCRDWRNRYIAHRDLNLALGEQSAIPLAEASRKQAVDALKAIADVLNAVQGHYLQASTAFDAAARHNSASTLIYLLNDGITEKKARENRISKGEFLEQDIPPEGL